MTKYVRLTNGLYSSGILVPEDQIWDKINDKDDWFQSSYYYNQNHYEQFQKTGTVAGIRDVTTDKIWFDFDCKEDPAISQRDAIEVIKRLEKDGINPSDLEIYFSGNAGFHVILNVNRELTPKQVEAICEKYAGDKGITFDTSVYDTSQILRVPYTKHKKSKLYKIPISFEELNSLDIESIKKKARTPAKISEFEISVVDLPESFYNIETKNEEDKETVVSYKDVREALKHRPSHWKDHKWLLVQGFFDAGERNNALMVIAATYKALGYDKESTYSLCKAALRQRKARTGIDYDKAELWNTIIETVFSENWNGGQYSIENNLWLRKYAERMGLDPESEKETGIVQIHDIASSFKEFVKHIEENTVKTGIKWLDDIMPITTGMNTGFVGAPGSGKTALCLEILKNTSKAGVISVFASLDMHRNRLFEKLLYKASNQSREKIYEDFKQDKEEEYLDVISRDYGNVWFYDRSSPTVADIREYILEVQRKTGKRVRFLMLDYFERVNSDKSEDTSASKDISGKLQDLVNDLDIALITLVQPNKFSLGGGPDTPIKSYTSIKGSSFLYQSFRSIVSIWRPFYTPEWSHLDNYMQMAILKNDLGEIGMETFGWRGKTGDIYELTQTEKEIFEKLLEEKNNAEKNSKNSDGWE